MKTTTLEAPAASTLHPERNVRTFGPRAVSGYGPNAMLTATVRYDDTCGNGYNSFAITGEIVTPASKRRDDCEACGMLHDDIARVFPELAPFLKWHGCSSDEPLHYIANTLYHAGDRDCHGLRKGEKRQIVNGRTKLPCWELVAVWPDGNRKDGRLDPHEQIDAEQKDLPTPPVMEWQPWCTVGEGKVRELDHARSSAIWPEATDAELMQEPAALRAQLEARHPALMAAFRSAVESLGFTF